ncbi:MAG: hypothetical protein GY858_09995 [Candidatus Omnitrophica bacterium]|nr:hypothetical protein [Candidatus Omnitrophota bacterium]
MPVVLKATIFLVLFFSVGCSGIRYFPQILTLRKYGSSQEQLAKDVEKQASSFKVLQDDIENGRLKAGISMRDVFSAYGDPILLCNADGDKSTTKQLLYRHPTKYFSTDKAYLYFNESDVLVYWRCEFSDDEEGE